MRPWYYYSLVPLLLLGLGRLMVRLKESWSNGFGPHQLAAFALVLISLSAGDVFVSLSNGATEGPPRIYIARQLESELPRGSSVGIFNAGTIAFLARNERIVNLDGLVNNDAYQYIKRNALCEYLNSRGIQWVGDYEDGLEQWKPFRAPGARDCLGAKRVITVVAGEPWVISRVQDIIGRVHSDGARNIASIRNSFLGSAGGLDQSW
jgi:hypothetical protein